jgi:hypothetical protein
MNESITYTTTHFSPTASLAAIGVKVSQRESVWPDPDPGPDWAENRQAYTGFQAL